MTRAARGQPQLIDINCHIRRVRETSIAIADGTTEYVNGREREKWFWLPQSQISIERHGDGTATVTMPEWLAIERGLV